MQAGISPATVSDRARTVRPPHFLVELEPWGRQFVGNLASLLRPPRPLSLSSPPADFWPDVFVVRGAPWRALGSSTFVHAALLFSLVALWDLVMHTPQVVPQNPLKHETLTYYAVSEYLPPLPAESAPAKVEKRGEPEYSKQRIVSVPQGANNLRQTIVNPRAPQMIAQDSALPNLVISTPIPISPPVAAGERTPNQLMLPLAAITPVQPPPDLPSRTPNQITARLPQPAIVEPPVNAADLRGRIGELNISAVEPQLAQPTLPIKAQRAALSSATGADLAVPPQPTVQSVGGSGAQAAGQLLVLNVRPSAPAGEVKIPEGSRLGTFAATPEGKPGAPGTPDIHAGGAGPGASPSGTAPGSGSTSGLAVPGISISGGPQTASSGAVVAAAPSASRPDIGRNGGGDSLSARPDGLARPGGQPIGGTPEQAPERVFSGRKYYTLSMNMPNLTSAAGSWIVRFAEFQEGKLTPGELTAPVAMNKVDPGYPPELMDRRVEGVVVLYAVIRRDGHVDSIRVLHSLEARLDRSATRALARWQFRPATKNGVPVDLEAVVQIPFQVRKLPF